VGLAIALTGGAIFATGVIMGMVDMHRTGIMYRDAVKKRIIGTAVTGWLIFVLGALLLYLSQQN
jgi:uncharacterized YccA/Bax inhibitor family protein